MSLNLTRTSIVTILGNRGVGKSNAAKSLVMIYPRFIIYDPLAEYGNLGDIILHDHLSLYRTKVKRIIYQDESDLSSRDALLGSDFPKVAKWVMEQTNICFMVEEIDLVANKHFIEPHLDQLLRRGRHAGISIIGVTRASNEVHNDLLRYSNLLLLFKMHFKNDLEFLVHWIGEEATGQLKGLPDFNFICYDLDHNQYQKYKPLPLI